MIVESEGAYHFYIGKDEYLGMLTYKGQLSDFRACILSNRIQFNSESRDEILKVIEKCLHTLLNRYLEEQTRHSIEDPERFKKEHVREEVETYFNGLKQVHRFYREGG